MENFGRFCLKVEYLDHKLVQMDGFSWKICIQWEIKKFQMANSDFPANVSLTNMAAGRGGGGTPTPFPRDVPGQFRK